MTGRVLVVAATLLAVLTTPTTAGPEKVAFPAEYKKSHALYATADRPDNKTVRDLYASPDAARAAVPGQPLPDGTVLTMEVYKAKLDDTGEAVMEKRRGWGSDDPEALRNGEWEYARFTASGQPPPNVDTKPCFQCHKPLGYQDFVFPLPRLAKPRN